MEVVVSTCFGSKPPDGAFLQMRIGSEIKQAPLPASRPFEFKGKGQSTTIDIFQRVGQATVNLDADGKFQDVDIPCQFSHGSEHLTFKVAANKTVGKWDTKPMAETKRARGLEAAQAPTTTPTGTTLPETMTPITDTATTWKVPGTNDEFKVFTQVDKMLSHPHRFLSLAERLRSGAGSAASDETMQAPDAPSQSNETGVFWSPRKRMWTVVLRREGQLVTNKFRVKDFRAKCKSEGEAKKQALEALAAAVACHQPATTTATHMRWTAGQYHVLMGVEGNFKTIGKFGPRYPNGSRHELAFRWAKKWQLAVEKELQEESLHNVTVDDA